jgi:hypothetical protein
MQLSTKVKEYFHQFAKRIEAEIKWNHTHAGGLSQPLRTCSPLPEGGASQRQSV